MKLYNRFLATGLLISMMINTSIAAHAENELKKYIPSLSALSSEAGNPPIQAFDGDSSTKWASQGEGQWLRIKLANEAELTSIGISFTSGDSRVYDFEIQTSTDAEEWTTVFKGSSSGTTAAVETFFLKPSKAGYVRFVGYGSNVNKWNNINEITGLDIYKTEYSISIDGADCAFLTETKFENGEYYVPLTDMLDEMFNSLNYSFENGVAQIRNTDQEIILDFNKKSITVNGNSAVGGDKLKYDNGTAVVPYSIFNLFNNIEADYDSSTQTIVVQTDYKARLEAAYKKIDDEFLGVFDWLVKLYDPETGGFYNTVSGAEYEEYYPSIEATGFFVAMCADSESGALNGMPDEFRQKLIHFFQSQQNPETGFWEEVYPKAVTYDDRDKARVYDQATSKLKILGAKPLYPLPSERIAAVYAQQEKQKQRVNIVTSADIKAAEEAAKDLQSEDNALPQGNDKETQQREENASYSRRKEIELPAGIPSYCRSIDAFVEQIASYSWDGDSWKAGDMAGSLLQYIKMLPADVRQYYYDAVFEWLEKRQSKVTGYWSTDGDISFNAVSGAFKVCGIYRNFGGSRKIPNPGLIFQSVIKTLRSGQAASKACYVRNPADVLGILSSYPEVASEMKKYECEIVELYAKMIHDMFNPDGGAGTSMYCSTGKFGGLVAGNGVYESDMDGTQQMWLARKYISEVFGREVSNTNLAEHYDEFFNRLMTKKPIVKKPYDAEKGIVYEENFNSCKDVYELLSANWGFGSENNYLVDKGENDKCFMIDDKTVADVEMGRVSFPRVKNGTIECDLKFNRSNIYSKNNQDVSYNYFYALSGGDAHVIELHTIDSGSDRLTFASAKKVNGSNMYTPFATVGRGEWFRLKIKIFHNSKGIMQTKYYINGKHIVEADGLFAQPGLGYIDGLGLNTSGSRCGQISIDNIRVTSD